VVFPLDQSFREELVSPNDLGYDQRKQRGGDQWLSISIDMNDARKRRLTTTSFPNPSYTSPTNASSTKIPIKSTPNPTPQTAMTGTLAAILTSLLPLSPAWTASTAPPVSPFPSPSPLLVRAEEEGKSATYSGLSLPTATLSTPRVPHCTANLRSRTLQ